MSPTPEQVERAGKRMPPEWIAFRRQTCSTDAFIDARPEVGDHFRIPHGAWSGDWIVRKLGSFTPASDPPGLFFAERAG